MYIYSFFGQRTRSLGLFYTITSKPNSALRLVFLNQ